jgi:hypothetical protein
MSCLTNGNYSSVTEGLLVALRSANWQDNAAKC